MKIEEIRYDTMILNIRTQLKKYILDNRIKSLVLGISGGIDSAICAALARPVCDELKIPLIGRSIPISTNTSDERDRAEKIGREFCTDFDEDYQLETVFGNIWAALKPSGWNKKNPKEDFRMGNIKARLRMILLYDLAQLHNGMVLSTDNYTELMLGFWTLHGDVGDYGMLQNLWKTEVYDIAQWIATYELEDMWKQLAMISVINADATDGLGISKTDLDQIMPGWEGSSREGYEKVDQILFSYFIGVKEIDGNPIGEHPVIQRHLRSEFKRNNPYNIPRNKIL